ncbi:hypothetical protein Poly30_02260 [Planctomycetes bacterium Poly30]|uniref:Uncharacterized protein n=1 Tax=Saltatorellus ferox TaxID=2528018 RepID=A0A518EKV8_9BACT|nr:hypothetical protein Poly30_02260 [Planctomycetes bacterium Poly30]
MIISLALLAFCAPFPQADVRIALSVGDPIPGGGYIAYLGNWSSNERGQLLVNVASANQVWRVILDDTLLLSRANEIAPGVDFVYSGRLALNDDGHWAAQVITSIGEALVVDGEIIAVEGQPLSAVDLPGIPAGTIYAPDGYGYQYESFGWSGSTLHVSLDTVAPGEFAQPNRRLFFELDDSTGSIALDRATAPGELITQENDAFHRNLWSHVAPDGTLSELTQVEDASGAGTSLIAVDGQPVLRTGDPSPVAGSGLNFHPSFATAAFGDDGQWAANLVHVHNPGHNFVRHLYRNGQPILSAGDPAPDGSQFPISNRDFNPQMASNGALLYQAVYSDPNEPGNSVSLVMLDDEVALSTKRDRLPDGRRFSGVNLVHKQHNFTDNGTLFTVQLSANDTNVRSIAFVEIAPGSVSECTAVPNSTGTVGKLTATGSAYLGRGGFTLRAFELPPQAFGHFIVSRNPGFIPMAGGGHGNLCLTGSIGRMIPANPSSGASGEISASFDLSQLPQPTGAVGATVGETWFFQLWHRDAGPAAPTSNFTQAYEILVK